MKAHFVTFLSPGTFIHEETEQRIASWDADKAIQMASKITERHGAKPFAFYFTTRSRTLKELDSKIVKTSGRYYLGGRIMTVAEVKSEMPHQLILIGNMEGNGWDKIVVNDNSWRISQPLYKDDVVLEVPEDKFRGYIKERNKAA